MKVLIPTDGSPASQAAVRQGLDLARKLSAQVTLLYVEEPLGFLAIGPEVVPYYPALQKDYRAVGERALAQAQELAQQEGVPAEIKLVEGHPVEAILAESHEHDLIVMGTHGRSGLSQLFLGSVTQGVLHRATRPVVVVRATT